MKKKETLHTIKVKKIKKIANGCWWIERYLQFSCGVRKS